MTLSAFIRGHLEAIIEEWEAFARTLLPSGTTLSDRALRDHCRDILLAVAKDMEVGLTDEERAAQSKETTQPPDSPESAAASHGTLRHRVGFDLVQLVAEFRAMRASVIALWRRSDSARIEHSSVEQMSRFNEAIDKALAESVESYSADVAASRDMFLAILGHDLRGPLAGIEMSSLLLAKLDLPEIKRQQAVMRIRRASRTMDRLITDLLDYTRNRLGAGIPIEPSDCDLGPVCEEALDAVRASHPDQQFVQRMSGDLRTHADVPRMQQVLSNLLNNAVQHGDPGAPVSLNVHGVADAIVLTVANSGQPIPADALQVIFEPLIQLRAAESEPSEHSKTSLGLGLFIVREIVRGHGGTIGVESSAEDGTVFTIRLPRAID
jgi:signal transduction histidine kinase